MPRPTAGYCAEVSFACGEIQEVAFFAEAGRIILG
jgi:hypothetical protein